MSGDIYKKSSIVIPLGKSKINYLDLKLTLRSIERFGKDYSNIVIVGEKPDWIQGVDHIGCSDNPDPRYKEKNILSKLQVACLSDKVTDDFFATNDDITFLNDFSCIDYPNYHKGEILPPGKHYKPNSYRIALLRTKNLLLNRGLDPLHYDIHRPIIYNKDKFKKSFDYKDVNFETPWGYVIKSLYAGFNRIKGEQAEDVKFAKKRDYQFYKSAIKGLDVISYDDKAFLSGLDEVLEEIFPDKSKYEK